MGYPHEAGKLLMDSPHEAAVDSWHPHKAAVYTCQKWTIMESHPCDWIGIRIRIMLHRTFHLISMKCHQLLFQWCATSSYFSLIGDLDISGSLGCLIMIAAFCGSFGCMPMIAALCGSFGCMRMIAALCGSFGCLHMIAVLCGSFGCMRKIAVFVDHWDAWLWLLPCVDHLD